MARPRPETIPELPAVVRAGPLRTHVLETLRELVIVRTLQPGQHLVEADLAERLEVSRGPVREALQALHAEGWVDLLPGRGAFVHAPGPSEADEVFQVRAALESEAARLAADRVDAADVAELRAICVRGRAAVAAGDEPVVVMQNSLLHRQVAGLSGVQLLSGYIATLDRRVRWFYRPLVRSRGTASWDEHDLLIEALEAHDGAKAAEVMRRHSEETRRAYAAVGES
jgi:DNA-binding GntR family transcriptional regulator